MKLLGKKTTVLILLSLLFFATSAGAGQGDFGLSAKVGTLGPGIEGTIGVFDTLNARLGFNYLPLDKDLTESDVEYEMDLNLLTATLMLDWHPFKNGFRLSVGGIYNGNELDAKGKPTGGSYTIGDSTYTSAEVGTLSGKIDFDSFGPYVGIGYGNAVGKNKRWGFVLDLGVVYHGSPDVALSADGTLSGNALFQSELEKERRQLEDELEDFSFYPVIAIGISYKF